MRYAERITFDAEQCGGCPCIRHFRLRVKDVLDLLAAGVGEKEILEDYAFLEPEDLRACLEFAAEQVNHPVLVNARDCALLGGYAASQGAGSLVVGAWP